jgi:hypothetical protein
MSNQIRVVAILLIVQGALETLYGLMMTAMGPLMYAMDAFNTAKPAAGAAPPPPWLMGAMSGFYVLMGLMGLGIGIFRILTGVKNHRLRGRTQGIIALGLGVLTLMSCYCMPTSIALLIYGLVVYLNDESQRAFERVENGEPPEAVLGSPTRFG